MHTAQPWSQPEALDPMAHMSTDLDDLGNLFEFGDIDLNNLSNTVENNGYENHLQQMQHVSHPGTPFEDMGPSVPPTTSMKDFVSQDHYSLPQNLEPQQQQFNNSHASNPVPYVTQAYQAAMPQMYMHQHPSQFQYSQHTAFAPGQHVPPTPNSFEMHGESAPFMQAQQQQQQQSHQRHFDHQQPSMADHQQRYVVRKDDANIAFTPMASPAATPSNFNVASDFTVNPGAYFSPLTSPMIHAQNAQRQQQQQQGFYTNPSTAPSSNATSPIDLNMDSEMNGDGMSLPEPAASQSAKPRKKATPRSLAASNRAKQSPVQKAAQKRKSSSMLALVAPKFNDNTIAQPNSAGLQKPAAFNGSSEDGSISPEPLSEALMGPPPRPTSSLTQSPAMGPQQHKNGVGPVGPAATPKSLLSRSAASQPVNDSEQGSQAKESGALDDLQLPEASVGPPKPPQINTRIQPAQADPDEQTPRTSSRKTPKLGPLSTPSSARPSSAVASPSVAASPMTASTPGVLLKDKKDAKGARSNSKKRGSAGPSTMPSPALRPRISPSIKPLLPEGTALHSPTHALLLASKSNYQNLLEGNHLPGVNYPDSLSTGLTSKRTSHKVAEQGRRNRINEALKEMQSLVPKQALKAIKESISDGSPEADGERDGKDGKDDAAVKASKAATVEMANIYIRSMQEKERQMEERMAELERRNEEMARKLQEQNGSVDSDAAVDSASPLASKIS